MEFIKLQLGCLIVLLYVAFIYYRQCRKYHYRLRESLYDELLVLGTISVILDGATAYTVNHLEQIPEIVNKILHALFLVSLDSVIFVLFLYMLIMTGVFPKRRKKQIALFIPFIINVLMVLCNIGSLEYVKGEITNYSMGISAYTCFIMAGIYIIMSIIAFFHRWHFIESRKRVSIFTYLLVLAIVTGSQMLMPELLITSIAMTVIILGIYMNQEDPDLRRLSEYHSEMVMGFANLIENRDDSTGGHIKRTSKYVKLIAEELRARKIYKDVLTKDYIRDLCQAAPMHDVGKIAIPDAILQKPGRLTEEEFTIMKSHAEHGGEIVRETLSNLGDEEYCELAYEVARYHHEKWNGKGYPEGLKRKEIPLGARIMAVADVFDAVSEKRCYRDAMPLEQCFEIIEQGSGQDFEPIIVEAFLHIREKVEKVHYDLTHKKE